MRWNRRSVTRVLTSLPAALAFGGRADAGVPAERALFSAQAADSGVTLTSVDGLRVGHATRAERPTGCTAILTPDGATAGVAVRGAAPGTRELALLDPGSTVQAVHGVVLAGGSAFGLAAADGVVQKLREQEIGFDTAGGPVPIVPAAILFDLIVGSGSITPTSEDGYAAAEAASRDPVAQGCVGAGAGATVGKYGLGDPMKGGIGSAGYRFEDGTVVAALVATNCIGDVRDPRTGKIVAGAIDAAGAFIDAEARFLAGELPRAPEQSGQNTTIGVVATNRALGKAQCHRLAGVAHDGIARAVVPAHTRFDGDTMFCLSTGTAPAVTDRELTR
ncbi:MAG: peptidase S58 family protein, partial [Gammaproteobacteria bacterium]|nr:P1 family peptidase [Gemmatimonadota bacterium]NIV53209.1 peptidase S58 family protein [Gammaproteobacteria bacterium]NIY37661.1 peptidase S58 family protein [Gemmatimonadota bacterium]